MGENNGEIDIVDSGGTLPYTYLWSNNETTKNISNLSPGSYSVEVTDSNGCERNDNANVNQLPFNSQINTTGNDPTETQVIVNNIYDSNYYYHYNWLNNGDTANIIYVNSKYSIYS